MEKFKVIASAIIKNNKGEILTITLNDVNGKTINIPPGGRPEIGEPLRDCVVREVREEVNLEMKDIKLVGGY